MLSTTFERCHGIPTPMGEHERLQRNQETDLLEMEYFNPNLLTHNYFDQKLLKVVRISRAPASCLVSCLGEISKSQGGCSTDWARLTTAQDASLLKTPGCREGNTQRNAGVDSKN